MWFSIIPEIINNCDPSSYRNRNIDIYIYRKISMNRIFSESVGCMHSLRKWKYFYHSYPLMEFRAKIEKRAKFLILCLWIFLGFHLFGSWASQSIVPNYKLIRYPWIYCWWRCSKKTWHIFPYCPLSNLIFGIPWSPQSKQKINWFLPPLQLYK